MEGYQLFLEEIIPKQRLEITNITGLTPNGCVGREGRRVGRKGMMYPETGKDLEV